MLESYFLADVSLARRAGVESVRYMVSDGRMVLNDSDLRRLRLTPQEFLTGLPVEMISLSESKRLIRENGYDLGGKVTMAAMEARGESAPSTATVPVNGSTEEAEAPSTATVPVSGSTEEAEAPATES